LQNTESTAQPPTQRKKKRKFQKTDRSAENNTPKQEINEVPIDNQGEETRSSTLVLEQPQRKRSKKKRNSTSEGDAPGNQNQITQTAEHQASTK